MALQWHIIRTETGREVAACEWLNRGEIETYRPACRVAVMQGRRRPRTYSMFPGYVFANLNPNHLIWPTIRDLPHVIGYLSNGNQRAIVSDDTIEKIREFEIEMRHQRHAKWAFKPGDTVRTTDSAGIFQGYEGLLLRIDKQDRATVEIILLGRCTPVALSAQWLELADIAPTQGGIPAQTRIAS